ncbi:MAG: phage tail protein [Rhodospirillaceae bacterium]|nr:phage tail protein [Rhodospirillales bacterium]
MSELDLLPVFTAAGLAAIQAAHQQGMAVKVTHIALGDAGAAIRDGDGLPLAGARAMVALGNERVRVALTAGGDESPTSVTMLAEVPAGDPEFWIQEVGFITDTGVLLAVWASDATNLGWRGAMTPWVFRFVLAWSDLPPNAITIDYNGDAALAAWALDQARTKAKVRHTVEASGQGWDDLNQAQLTEAINDLITAMITANAPDLSNYAQLVALAAYAKLDAAQSFTKAQRGSVAALVDGATVTPDFAAANHFALTLGGNRTLANPSNMVAGQSGIIVITQDVTGSRTLSFGSYWKFASGSAPSLTTTASAVDVLAYYVESANRITARLHSDVR